MENIKKMKLWESILMFAVPSAYFILLTKYLTPYLSKVLRLHPALSWYITGYLVFIPLFIEAIVLVKKEDRSVTLNQLLKRFRIRKITKSDLKSTISATILTFACTGMIMLISKILSSTMGFPELKTTPDFMKYPTLMGPERLYLLVWLPMFLFNILGEQMLWQGYILPRQELEHGKLAWLVNSLCWLLFHFCFGIDLMVLLLPCLLIIPYAIQKTKNTTTGMIIHAALNGPMLVIISLGLIH
jgi:membrane protease YdiL (CAAX protease family)